MQEPGSAAQLDPAVDLSEFAAQKLLTPQEVEDLVFSVAKAGFDDAVTAAELTVYLAADPLLITVRDDKGWTPLLWAAFHGHTPVVAVMLDNGGDGRYRSWMEEMKSDQMEVKGAASDAPASFPVNSPLHWASFKGNAETVWLLLQRGFSVSDIDDCGNTCVHLASASGHHDIVKCLLCSGVDLTATNWYGNTALALATAAATRQLLQRLSEQTKCAATNVYFGPDELMHLCYCCERGFTEDASFPQVVCGSVASETLKPLRYCSECVFTIQEAESALDSALHPSHGAGDIAGLSSPVTASGGPRSKSPSRTSPSRSKSRGVDTVTSPPQASPQEASADLPSGHAPSYDAAPASRYAIEAPADLLSNLDESDLPKLKAVAARAVEVGGDARLVAAAAAVISRLEAGLVLQDAISALQNRRPLARRAEANALVDAIRVATDAQCSPSLLSSAERCLHSCLAEVKLLGAATVCKNISIASHANDGDVKHLRDALSSLDAASAKQPAAVEAASLCQRLDAEIGMADCFEGCKNALADLERRVRKYADEDPTELPFLPVEPGQEEAPQQRMPTRQQQALAKLDAAILDLQKALELGSANGADAALCARAKADLAAARVALKEGTDVETARIARFEEERVKRERKAKRGAAAGKKK